MLTMINPKYIIPFAIVLSIFLGTFAMFEYGKYSEKSAAVVKAQATYIDTRTKIDAAINHNRPADANDALARLRTRQGK